MRFWDRLKNFAGFSKKNKPDTKFRVLYYPSNSDEFDALLPVIIERFAELAATEPGFRLVSIESFDCVTGQTKDLLPEVELAALHRNNRVQEQD